MVTTGTPIPYLQEISEWARSPERVDQIRAAIQTQGFWEDWAEWRISTITHTRIDPLGPGRGGYQVRVECDQQMSCICPTLERAIEFLGIYEHLIADLFWTVGWPSYAHR